MNIREDIVQSRTLEIQVWRLPANVTVRQTRKYK